MSTSYTIRKLGSDDAEVLRAIRLAALRCEPDTFGSVYEVELERPLGAFADRLVTSIVFAAFASRRAIGMLGLHRESGLKDAHKAFLWGFFVEPEYRRSGIGRALLERALEEAAHIVEQVSLAVVTGNPGAIALYQALGFTAYGTEPNALKGPRGYADELLMIRMLQKPTNPPSLRDSHS
jgi:ribosomal protein S18 acetylase RimI-like enzyme